MPKFDTSSSHGFVRIACVTPKVHLANPQANLAEHVQLAMRADEAGAAIRWMIC
jgi:NAD+ synthase (glutamine-hydrolysing)